MSKPAADVTDSLGSAQVDLHYEAIATEGGPSRTVAIVVGSDRQLAFSVPITLARRSSFPVIIVP